MKLLALILLLLCTPVLAHDANYPELNRWFDHLSSGSCIRRATTSRFHEGRLTLATADRGRRPQRERNLD